MITVQLSTQEDASSWLIRQATWSRWSHVDLVLPDGTLLGARIDGGVKIRPNGYDHFTDILRLSVASFTPLSRALEFSNPTAEAALYAWAHAQVGKPYDWSAILGVGLHRDWRDEGKWFCSELVYRAFEVAGLDLLRIGGAWRVTPGLLSRSPYWRAVGMTVAEIDLAFGKNP